MADRIDHAAEALDALIAVSNIEEPLTVAQLLAEAQAHATLALVEQQRIANRLELRAQMDTAEQNDDPYVVPADIAAALGIETGAAS